MTALTSLALATLLVAGQESAPQRDSGRIPPPEQTCYDVLHYTLDLRVDPAAKTIEGSLEMRARLVQPTDGIILDLDHDLHVQGVELMGKKASFEHAAGEIRVEAGHTLGEVGSEFSVLVHYGGTPRVAPRPPWTGGFTWSKTPSGADWIATTCQQEGADLWWPCKDQPDDEPDTMDIHVTVPSGLVVASNGRLVGHEAAGKGWERWNWHVSTPINAYGVALNIGPYEVLTKRITSVAGDEFDVSYWVLPENVEKGRVLLEDMVQQMHFMEKICGPYAFRADKYGVVETPHLGMEHQSIIAYGNHYAGNPWGPQQGFDFLLQHEFSHEWWANLVTARNWNDFWIHEGIGTYCQALYVEELKGIEQYHREMNAHRSGHANRAALAPRDPRSTQEMYFGNREGAPGNDIYNKGSWVVHSLRWALGDETFFKVLRRWAYPQPELEASLDGAACRFTTTDELLAIAEEVSGRELDWFFDVYLRQAKIPRLLATEKEGDLLLAWEVPEDLPFPMPVGVRIGDTIQRVEMPDGQATIELKGQDYEVDPDRWILKDD